MKISTEKRIWVNGVRLDMLMQKYAAESASSVQLDDIIDKNWMLEINNSDDESEILYSFITHKNVIITLQINEFLPISILANTIKIYKSDFDESIGFNLNDTEFDIKYSIARYCCIDKYICIDVVTDVSHPNKYLISITINDVPYETLSENLVFKFGLIAYPLIWTIQSGGVDSRQHMMVQLSADKPPRSIVSHDVSTKYYKDRAELYAMHMTRFEQSVFGIIKNAIVLARLDMMNESSFFDDNYADARLYIITEMGDECPFGNATISLRPIEEPSSITISFKEFIYAYRGVLPPNSAIVKDSKVYICSNGIAIRRKATKELESLITECVYPPAVTEEKLERMDKYICDNYVHSNMVDKIIVVDKNYGIITHNVMLQNDKLVGNDHVLTIEEDFEDV